MAKIITSLLLLGFAASAFAAPGFRIHKTNDYHYRQISQTPTINQRDIDRLEERLHRIERRLDRIEDELDLRGRQDRTDRPRDYRDHGKSSLGISITSDGIKLHTDDDTTPPPRGADREWLCSIDTMGGTFRGVGRTKAVAKNKALKECEKKNGKSIFCADDEVVCEQ